MHEKTFAELYCESRGIPMDRYADTVIKETLFAHARLVAPFIRALWPRHFSSDREFADSVGLLRRFRDYSFESEEFAHHPDNRGFWRVTVNIRVSSRRMRRLVRQTLHPELATQDGQDHTSVPFGGTEEKPSNSVRKINKPAA